MTTPAKLVLLDLDGTLCDSAPGITSAMQTAMAGLGLPVPQDEVIRSQVGPPLTDSLAAYGVPQHRIPEVIAAYRREFESDGMWSSRPFAGIVDQLIALRAAQCSLLLATSKPERYAKAMCEHWGLAPHLDGIYGAPDDGTSSTKAGVIARALGHPGHAADATAATTLMVGDRRQDVDGAAAHGIACLGVGWGYATAGELVGAVGIVPAVSDLSAAVLRHLEGQAQSCR
ncbi:MAG: HAD hydrolase-like protein [Beutenbergiaceae bacterium]